MNSTLQILYMNPWFRQLILSLELCDTTISQPTFIIDPSTQFYEVLIAIQKIFTKLKFLESKATM